MVKSLCFYHVDIVTITKWFVITVETAYLIVHLYLCIYSAYKVSWFKYKTYNDGMIV